MDLIPSSSKFDTLQELGETEEPDRIEKKTKRANEKVYKKTEDNFLRIVSFDINLMATRPCRGDKVRRLCLYRVIQNNLLKVTSETWLI